MTKSVKAPAPRAILPTTWYSLARKLDSVDQAHPKIVYKFKWTHLKAKQGPLNQGQKAQGATTYALVQKAARSYLAAKSCEKYLPTQGKP